MTLSVKIRNFMEQSSWIRKMFEEGARLKLEYGAANVFDLSLGNPVMEPPQELINALKACVEDSSPGMHRYMSNSGFLETRQAIAESLIPECQVEVGPDNILMTCGAAGALNVTLKTLLDSGDEVIVLAPYFVEYIFYVDNHGGKTRTVPTDENFLPDLKLIEQAINKNTKAIIVNSPNNPTGVVYPRSVWSELAALLREQSAKLHREIYLISDDPYKKIVYDGVETPNPMEFYTNSIYITSHSKDLGVPGERIGFIALHPEAESAEAIMSGMVFCNRTLGFVNAPALLQRAVTNLQSVKVDVEQYREKRDFLYRKLIDIGYSVVKPQGAFYLFPRSPIEDEVEFCKILANYKTLVVPGRGFGLAGYFRISYCLPDETIRGSVNGFESAFMAVSQRKVGK